MNRKHTNRRKLLKTLRVLQVLGLCLVLLVISQCFVACVNNSVTLTIAVSSSEAAHWEPLITEFEKKTGIKVTLDDKEKTTDEVEKYYTSELSQHKPSFDLVYMDVIWVPKFAQQQWLKDLSQDFSQSELSNFLTKDVEAGRYSEKLYRVPFRTTGGVLYYRKDLLEQAGYQKPPATFVELLKIAKSLQEKHSSPHWGYFWQGQEEGLAAMFVEVLRGFGGFWIKNETEVGLDQPEAMEAIRFLRSTIQQRVSPPDFESFGETETRDRFLKGEAVFMRNWPEILAQVSSNEISSSPEVHNNIGITKMPVKSVSNDHSGSCQGSWGLGISRYSEHPAEALELIKFLTSDAAQRKFVLKGGYLPSRASVFIDPTIVDQYPHYPKLLEVLNNTVARPPVPQYRDVSEILRRHLKVALQGKRNPETEMIYAANETRELLRKSS
jgi:multiple sugar transport system substrate-binding protein